MTLSLEEPDDFALSYLTSAVEMVGEEKKK